MSFQCSRQFMIISESWKACFLLGHEGERVERTGKGSFQVRTGIVSQLDKNGKLTLDSTIKMFSMTQMTSFISLLYLKIKYKRQVIIHT